jgi:hypothetical protein
MRDKKCLQSKSYSLYFLPIETSERDTVKHYLQTHSDINIKVALSLGCNLPATLKTCFLRLPKDGIRLYYEISMDRCAVGA